MQKLVDEQLEGSGFVSQEIEEAIIEINLVNDIQASSYLSHQKNMRIINQL